LTVPRQATRILIISGIYKGGQTAALAGGRTNGPAK